MKQNPSTTREDMTDNLCNLALMLSLHNVRRQALIAYDKEDHQTIALSGKLWDSLVEQINQYVAEGEA